MCGEEATFLSDSNMKMENNFQVLFPYSKMKLVAQHTYKNSQTRNFEKRLRAKTTQDFKPLEKPILLLERRERAVMEKSSAAGTRCPDMPAGTSRKT